MKKLLKCEVCGSREQCMGALFMGEKSTTALKKERERERERENVETQTQTLIQTLTESVRRENKNKKERKLI